MFEKFKTLSIFKKIIVSVIGLVLLPLTLLILSFDLMINGIKNKKTGKVIGGMILCAFLLFTLFNSSGSTDTPKSRDPQKQELTTEGLLEKLEGYELMYSTIPASIEESTKSNDTFQMQKSFSESRDFLNGLKSELNTLSTKYKTNSDEYKAVYNLTLAYFSLSEACNYGIKYIDNNEFEYYEKFEENCESSGQFMNNYLAYKEKLK